MKKLVTISTVGSFAVGVVSMLIELAAIGDDMKYLATFLVAFVVSFATIFSALLLARELREQQITNRDFAQLRPEHVDALRELWENKRIVRDESNKNVVLWLCDSGMVRAFTTSGNNLAYKLTEKGEDVCDRLIEKDWTL